MDYAILKAEITDDPLGRGYAAMTDAEAAASLNAPSRTRPVTCIDPAVALKACVPSEFKALATADKQTFLGVLAIGPVDPSNATIKAIFADIFAAGTTTRANLLALATEPCSRAEELGLGVLSAGDITRARAI
jgi:hypothetical protein